MPRAIRRSCLALALPAEVSRGLLVHLHKRVVIWSVGICVALAAALWPARADAQWRYPGYYVPRDLTALRLIVKPNDAKVYVDGYYAGIVDDFDGVFQRLHVPAGQHEV